MKKISEIPTPCRMPGEVKRQHSIEPEEKLGAADYIGMHIRELTLDNPTIGLGQLELSVCARFGLRPGQVQAFKTSMIKDELHVFIDPAAALELERKFDGPPIREIGILEERRIRRHQIESGVED